MSSEEELLLERLWKTHGAKMKAWMARKCEEEQEQNEVSPKQQLEEEEQEEEEEEEEPVLVSSSEEEEEEDDEEEEEDNSSDEDGLTSPDDDVVVEAVEGKEQQQEGDTAKKKASVLDCIAQAQSMCLESEPLSDVFQHLVQGLLHFAESDLGFIGQIQYNVGDGSMYLTAQCGGVAHISKEDKQFLFSSPEHRFLCLESIYGTCLTTKKPYIANDPKTDPNRLRTPLPPGHPQLDNFLGIPFFRKGELIGMLGIANKRGGYTQADVALLEPFSVAVSCIIQAYMQMRENEKLITTLEQKVRERTRKLEKVNEDLADANRRVVRASKLQLQHFACMSHEIRYVVALRVKCQTSNSFFVGSLPRSHLSFTMCTRLAPQNASELYRWHVKFVGRDRYVSYAKRVG